jgi:hypothetical protein
LLSALFIAGQTHAAIDATVLARHIEKEQKEQLSSTCLEQSKRKCTKFSVVHSKNGETVTQKELSRVGMEQLFSDLKRTVFDNEANQGWQLAATPVIATGGVICLAFGCNDSGKNNYPILLLLPVGIAIDKLKLPVTIPAAVSYQTYKAIKTRHYRSIRSKVMKGKSSKKTINVEKSDDWSLITFRLQDNLYR